MMMRRNHAHCRRQKQKQQPISQQCQPLSHVVQWCSHTMPAAARSPAWVPDDVKCWIGCWLASLISPSVAAVASSRACFRHLLSCLVKNCLSQAGTRRNVRQSSDASQSTGSSSSSISRKTWNWRRTISGWVLCMVMMVCVCGVVRTLQAFFPSFPSLWYFASCLIEVATTAVQI